MKTMHAAAIILSVIFVAGFFGTAQAISPVKLMSTESGGPSMETMQSGFDRETCEQDCRSRYGVDIYFETQQWGRGGHSRPGYYLYANCIQQCNQRFWKEFDRRTEGLKYE